MATNASTTTLLTNLFPRRAAGQCRSLDGVWKAILDPYELGHVELLGAYFKDAKPAGPSDRVEYDFDTAMDLDVPGDWNTQRPELLYYEGSLWYRRRVVVGAEEVPGTRSFLTFGAANHTTRIYLDGELIGTHVGGFGPFAVEVTGRVGVGDHSLVVVVNNRRERDRIPAMTTDWWNFGGLTRSVELVTVPAVFLRDAWLTMNADGCVVGGVTIDGAADSHPVDVRVSIPGSDVTSVHSVVPGEPVTFEVLDADSATTLERWSPGSPTLHDVQFECGADVLRDEVGFRTVRVEGAQIFVNGEPTFLAGIAIHGEGPSGGRRAFGDNDAHELLGWASDLGANFVRLGHYQHDEAMLREADRRGLLAWCELPVYWGIDFANERVLENAKQQADELVTRDRSRASAILWSAANETIPGEARTAFLASLLGHIRDLDPTRLITAALFTSPTESTTHHVDDELGNYVDVIGINQYSGWYYGERSGLTETTWTSAFGKPMIFTELGAGAKAGLHGSEDEIWTEEFQDAVYSAQIEMIDRQDDVVGMSPWILKDFRSPVRVLAGVQDGYNRKGIVSEEGERKLAFGTLQKFYKLKAGNQA